MITLAQAKTLLQISDSAYDTLITFSIPLVTDSVCEYCKNYFLDNDIYIKSDDVAFANSDNSITIDDFDDEFIAGDYIRIFETKRNNSHALIDSISSTKLVVSNMTVIDEVVESSIIIFRANYPNELQLICSKMLKFIIENDDTSFKREKIDDYEIEKFQEKLRSGFPDSIMKGLSRYKKFYFDEIYLGDYS